MKKRESGRMKDTRLVNDGPEVREGRAKKNEDYINKRKKQMCVCGLSWDNNKGNG